jgi:hypothetical protein
MLVTQPWDDGGNLSGDFAVAAADIQYVLVSP